MSEYRIGRDELLVELGQWNRFLKRKVHLIACGGTALTLLGVKSSTKDIDFMVPNDVEYRYLLKTLNDMGYRSITGSGLTRDGRFVYDFFCGKKIHTTELLETPLRQEGNLLYEEFSYIYLGILNYYDLLLSKLFRETSVDFDDCHMLIDAKRPEIDMKKFESRFLETAKYDVSEKKLEKTLECFINETKEREHE